MFMIDGRRNSSRVWFYQSCLRIPIDRTPVIRKIFVYRQKLGGAEEVCTRRRSERTTRMTSDGSLHGQWQMDLLVHHPTVPNISHGYDQWMSVHIGHVLFRILPSVFPCYLTWSRKRSATRRSCETITHVIYYLLPYENNIFRMNTVVYCICAFVYIFSYRAIMREKGNDTRASQRSQLDSFLTLRNDQTVYLKHHVYALK